MNRAAFDPEMGIIEDALRTMPLVQVPAALQSRVMQRVRVPSAAARFTFPWLEAAISLMLSTVLTGALYLMIGIPLTTVLRLEQYARLLFALPGYRPVIAAGLAGLGLLAVCLLLTVRLFQPLKRGRVHAVRLR
jgi:hypothetical protein